MSVKILRTEHPINGGRRLILDEESFVDCFITRGLTGTEICAENPEVTKRIVSDSRHFYREKYGDSLRKAKARNYSKAMQGNIRGRREHPTTLLPVDQLSDLFHRGWPIFRIAKHFGTSEFLVQSNISHYRLFRVGSLPCSLQSLDSDVLSFLDGRHPNFLSVCGEYQKDLDAYFGMLLTVYSDLFFILSAIRNAGKRRAHYRERGKLRNNHYHFSSNKSELVFSSLLRNAGIEHEFPFFTKSGHFVDFAVPNNGHFVFIEIDGSIHHKKKEKDKARENTILGHYPGSVFVRFTAEQVLRESEGCLCSLKRKLSV